MKMTLLTYGSRGDVQPFVALALGLQKAGHSVRLAAPHRFAGFASQYGIPFTPLPGDPEQMSAWLNDARNNVFRAIKSMADYVFSIAQPAALAAFSACDDVDVIIHSFLFTTGAHSLAHARGIPDVSVQTFPTFAPTRAFPMVAMPNIPPGATSYFTHWLATQIFWHVGNWGFRRLRAANPDLFSMELRWPFPERASYRSALPEGLPLTPLLFAYSPVVLPRPGDWKTPAIHITGYFTLDTATTYQPPPDLLNYLVAGEAPICVSFGSMVNQEAGRIDHIVRAALARTRQRAVILTGWGGSKPSHHDENVFYLDAAPHDWLFPRCKSVIHHGGAGTTGAGLRAGIPNIVIPHGIDQTFWGRRVAAIGAGPAPVDIGKLSVDSLISALVQANGAALRHRADEIGCLTRAEDGVGEAVRIIQEHAAGFHQYQTRDRGRG
jgi:sterol 3beta-glucosyltransferase